MKSLQITFIDYTLLFMSIHKVYMPLLIMFIKFFVIQISYHGIQFRVCKFREALISRFFTIVKIAN